MLTYEFRCKDSGHFCSSNMERAFSGHRQIGRGAERRFEEYGVWLFGSCFGCYDNWERWEGSTP